jgi:hypothetical protein
VQFQTRTDRLFVLAFIGFLAPVRTTLSQDFNPLLPLSPGSDATVAPADPPPPASLPAPPKSRVFFGGGLLGYAIATEARHPGAGFFARLEFQNGNIAAAPELRVAPMRFHEIHGIAYSFGFGLRLFVIKGDFTPFFGGGVTLLKVPNSKAYIDIFPTSPFLEMGVELWRLRSSHLDIGVRGEVPAFLFYLTDYPVLSIMVSYAFQVNSP